MGDHRAGPTGSTATADHAPPAAPGKRAARHVSEQRTSQPYAGRRVAGAAPEPPTPVPASAPVLYTGRRVAGRSPLTAAVALAPVVPEPDELEDVSAHLVVPTTSPAPTAYVGRRLARPVELIADPAPVAEEIVVAPAPVAEAPVAEAPVVEAPVLEATVVEAPVAMAELRPARTTSKAPRMAGRRAASRRTRVPSLPLLAGVAVLAISAGGALQAMHPGLAGASDGHISPASAMSGSSGGGSANALGSRGTSVSRDSDRQTLSAGSATSLRAAADAQAKERDASLSALAGRAEKRAADLKLHQWVLPVQPGVYHLTARFGDYSSLWSNFHTGLDFAAPTGTPIMAVARGTITEVGYSGAYGNRTIEKLPDGTELWYCHQNEFGTAVGDKVNPGQVIGYVGSTGNVTGPHLHLEVHPGGGDPVDPYAALVVHGLYPGPPA